MHVSKDVSFVMVWKSFVDREIRRLLLVAPGRQTVIYSAIRFSKEVSLERVGTFLKISFVLV